MLRRVISYNFSLLSWEKIYRDLARLQLRLYKCFFVNDSFRALNLQKLIISSKSTRLVSIRDVTQLDSGKRIAGIDGLLFLNFTERFLLSENLRLNIYNWSPSVVKNVKLVNKFGSVSLLRVSTVSDRCWQCIVRYALEPAHEAFFNPRNLGFRSYITVHDLQKIFFYNLGKNSFGKQKRVLSVNLETCFKNFGFVYLLSKIILPRSIKLGLFRTLNLGFIPRFASSYFLRSLDFGSLLANIILDGIENISSSVRFGYQLVLFLKPLDNEVLLLERIKVFLVSVGLCYSDLMVFLSSSCFGFDFMGWKFRVLDKGLLSCFPSIENYNAFLQRVKVILNNSNYGSVGSFSYIYDLNNLQI